ncbi:hypothetical protein Pint_30799 [Pistacia integerrima]|nr:hypothetical protein Pint_30799 [Pistacia integerrima]
MGFWSF